MDPTTQNVGYRALISDFEENLFCFLTKVKLTHRQPINPLRALAHQGSYENSTSTSISSSLGPVLPGEKKHVFSLKDLQKDENSVSTT